MQPARPCTEIVTSQTLICACLFVSILKQIVLSSINENLEIFSIKKMPVIGPFYATTVGFYLVFSKLKLNIVSLRLRSIKYFVDFEQV